MSTLPEVDKAILETIRENLQSVPKSAVILQRNDSVPKKTPAIRVWNRSFTTSDVTISSEGPAVGEILKNQFNGDGKKVTFKLSNPPLRPLLSVEHPESRIAREGEDFKVDYKVGAVTFVQPPVSGDGNVIVQFYSGKGAAEVRGLRVSLEYCLDVWAADIEEESRIVNEVALILLKSRDFLGSKGILVRLRGGSDLTAKDDLPEGIFCKRLECGAEATLFLKVPVPRINKIQLEHEETVKAAGMPSRRKS